MSKNNIKSIGYLLAVLFLFVLVSYFLFLQTPPVWPDEAIFLDTARTFADTGTMATTIFGEAIPGLSSHALWYPPLYFYILALWTSIFGNGIEVVRMLSFLFAIGTLIVFFLLLVSIFHKPKYALLGTLLLALDPSFGIAARVGRMDSLSFFFLMATLFVFIQFNQTKKHRNLLLCGIGAALGILTHPLGFILPATMVLSLLVSRDRLQAKVSTILTLAIPSIIACLFWAFMIWEHIDLFVQQYGLQFARKATMVPQVISNSSNLLWAALFAIELFFAVSIIFSLAKQFTRIGFIFASGLLICVGGLVWGKEFWYTLYFQPFTILIGLYLLQRALGLRIVYTASIFALVLIYSTFMLQELFAPRVNYHTFASRIGENIPAGKHVFLSVIPDPYFDLKQEGRWVLYEFPTVPVTDEAYQALLNDVDYIVISVSEDQKIARYIEQNTKSITQFAMGRYQVGIIELVARDLRQ